MNDFDSFVEYLKVYPEMKWIAIGAILLIFEIFTGTMWMLFAGLAALTLGGLISFKILMPGTLFAELAWFFFVTGLYAIILWKPMRKGLRKKAGGYDTLVGSSARVTKLLKKGKTGSVRWSGTDMNAKIAPSLDIAEIHVGEEVWIHDVKGNLLIVSPFPPGVNLGN